MGKQIEAVFPGVKERDTGGGPQDPERVRPEGHDHAAATDIGGGGAGGPNQGPVAQVDSVELADRHGRRAVEGRRVRPGSGIAHGAPLAWPGITIRGCSPVPSTASPIPRKAPSLP